MKNYIKKGICFVLTLFLFVALCNCNESDSVLSENPSTNSDISTVISENSKDKFNIDISDIDKEKIEELQKELQELQSSLTSAEAEKEDLLKQIERAKTKTIYIKDEIYLLLETAKQEPLVYSEKVANKVSIKFGNNEPIVNISENYTTSIEISPKKNKIIMNENYFWEATTGTVFLYDIDTREKKELLLPDLPTQFTPAFMKWLDNRYFLFVVQLDNGTIVKGGNVYIYDTETDNYRLLIGSDDF